MADIRPHPAAIAAEAADLVAFRRDLHRHPELRFEERRTGERVAARLVAAGIEVLTGQAETGVVGRFGNPDWGPRVLVRADMDALPTEDLKDVPYRSVNPGVAHACGHDVHTAAVLGVAERLAADPDLPGAVTVVFQPAEEIPFGGLSGGREILATGVLDGVDAVLGLHCWPALPAGTIGVDRDVAMGAKDAFRIAVRGRGAHAATPSGGRDAVLAASQMVVALNTLVGRELDPGQRVALNVGTIHGGRSQSIVPPDAELTGTVRSIDPALAARMRAAIERTVGGLAAAAGVEAIVEWKNAMPAVRNHPALVNRALQVLTGCGGVDAVAALEEPPMTADDFALYAEQRPGLYIKLGVRAADGLVGSHPLHDGRFDVDERAIAVAVDALSTLVLDLLRTPLEGAR